jgi:hypothetical protein
MTNHVTIIDQNAPNVATVAAFDIAETITPWFPEAPSEVMLPPDPLAVGRETRQRQMATGRYNPKPWGYLPDGWKPCARGWRRCWRRLMAETDAPMISSWIIYNLKDRPPAQANRLPFVVSAKTGPTCTSR